jgi:RNA polymerase sigma-70 factor, ECF subfamily
MESGNQAVSQESFEDAVLPHRALMHRVAVKMTGSSAEADDLVQETLLRAFRSFGRLRPDSQVRPWLMRILHNTFVSSWRRKKRENEILQPAICEHNAPWVLPRKIADAPDIKARRGLGDEVVSALYEIPDQYRSCVVLVDIQDKSYKEAAELIGRPLGTVMSRLYRGRRMLKGKLDGYARREGYIPNAA